MVSLCGQSAVENVSTKYRLAMHMVTCQSLAEEKSCGPQVRCSMSKI